MRNERRERLRALWVRLGFEREWQLVFASMLIGAVVGGIAMAFILPALDPVTLR